MQGCLIMSPCKTESGKEEPVQGCLMMSPCKTSSRSEKEPRRVASMTMKGSGMIVTPKDDEGILDDYYSTR